VNRHRLNVTFWLLLIAGLIGYWWWLGRLERSQDLPIRVAARRYGVEPALVKAIVWRESRFHAQTRGRVGEIGLMQLREEAAQEWADAEHISGFEHVHCFDPGTNTLAGTWYLKKLLNRYRQTDNPVPYALADFNAGRGNVLKWISGEATTNSQSFIEQIGFPGTKAYVDSVMRRYQKYQSTIFP
jgi:peptidoglycan lytic transglycosylase